MQIKTLQTEWSKGHYQNQNQYETIIANAKALGICDYARIILEMDYAELMELYDD